jgi:secreted Zn-dependent insulinase-like peptidase
VCLINSDTANKAALSMSIKAGHFNDPENCPGLAHLFEHMMFASSENHAKGNDLHELLSKNRGYINAWTSSELTNFHFDCAPSVFLNAFEQLVDMILNPMYSELGVEREISAIDAEFKMRLNDDIRRLYDVHKHTVNPKHPFYRFSVGSQGAFSKYSLSGLVTLLNQYHQQHVFGQNIKVSIVLPTCLSVNEKSKHEKQIIALLESFPTHQQSRLAILENRAADIKFYEQDQLQKIISVKPHKSTRNAIITFCLPNIDHFQHYKPLLVLAHILEDCSPKGLKQYLKKRNWCEDLSAGGALRGSNYQEFSINLRLTVDGEKHLNAILAAVFVFIKQTEEELIQAWHIKEKAKQLSMQRVLSDSPSPIDEATAIASRLHEEPLKELLESDIRLDVNGKHEPQALAATKSVLAYMHPQATRVYHISCDVQTDRLSPYYRTPYSIETLSIEAFMKNLGEQVQRFELSPPNKYMPDLDKEPDCPQIRETSHLVKDESSCWLAYDDQYGHYKSDIYLSIEHPNMVGSPQALAVKKLWLSMVNEYLETEFGHAEFAGLYYKLYGHQAGLSIHISGFADKQRVFAQAVIQAIIDFTFEQSDLDKAIRKMQSSLENAMLNKPINRLFFELNCHLQPNTYAHNEVLSILPSITTKEVVERTEQYWQYPFVETLIAGCVSEQQTRSFHASMLELVSKGKRLNKRFTRNKRRVNLLNQTTTELSISSTGSEHACICYFQAPKASTEQTVLMIMLEKLLSALLFDGLRNKRKLGYMVGCGFMPINGHPGLSIYVQSPKTDARQLHEAILEELSEIIDNTNLSKRRVNDLIKTLQDQFSVSHTNQSQFAQKQWLNLDSDAPEKEDQRIKKGLAQLNLDKVNVALDDLRHQKSYRLLTLMAFPKRLNP